MAGKDGDARVNDVRRITRGEESPNRARQFEVQVGNHDVFGIEQASQPNLTTRVPPHLRNDPCGHNDRAPTLDRPAEQDDEFPIVSLDPDEGARIEHQRHRNRRSAAARSAFVIGPPDSANISANTSDRRSLRPRSLIAPAM